MYIVNHCKLTDFNFNCIVFTNTPKPKHHVMYDVTDGCRHHSFDVDDWLIFFRGKYIGQRLSFVLNNFFNRFLADTQIPHTVQGKPTNLLPMFSICPNKTYIDILKRQKYENETDKSFKIWKSWDRQSVVVNIFLRCGGSLVSRGWGRAENRSNIFF